MRWLVFALLILGGAGLLFATQWDQPNLPQPGEASKGDTATGKAITGSSSRPGPRMRRGSMDVTFLATADTHFGYQVTTSDEDEGLPRTVEEARGIEKVHREAIDDLNHVEGRPYPTALGSKVGKPLGLLIAGDLTEYGTPSSWARFEAYYGLTGDDGLLRYPVFETIGNHDKVFGFFVKRRVAERHDGIRYSWDWHDLHIACLGEAPDDEDLAWLEKDLQGQGREVGVVLYFHFPLTGPFSRNWFGDGDYRSKLRDVIDGYQVLAIFHGHYHASGTYRWQGYDVYNVGSAKHRWQSFAVVRVTDERFTVASWNYRTKAWWWWHDKPIFGASGKPRRWLSSSAALIRGPTGRASRP
jgi:cytolysin (calcineurin-like family phosphatase)